MQALRLAQDELEAKGAPAVTARTVGPALQAVHRAAGWIATCGIQPAQLATGKDGAVEVGLANAEDISQQARRPCRPWRVHMQPSHAEPPDRRPSPPRHVTLSSPHHICLRTSPIAHVLRRPDLAQISDNLRRANGALTSAFDTLHEVLASRSMQPLANANGDACKYLLQTYSRRLYPVIAPSLVNKAAPIREIQTSTVASTLLPPAPVLRGAPLEKISRLCGEAQPSELFYMARNLANDHLRPFTRLLRRADMMVFTAVLQLPL